MSSSQWSSYAKSVFLKWSGIAAPPKMMRASYITWLRGSTDCPEILKAAARAQRHQLDTQASDKYDKESNDRLIEAAVKVRVPLLGKHGVHKRARARAATR